MYHLCIVKLKPCKMQLMTWGEIQEVAAKVVVLLTKWSKKFEPKAAVQWPIMVWYMHIQLYNVTIIMYFSKYIRYIN